MRNRYPIATFLMLLASCTISYTNKTDRDLRIASGKDYETGKPISPKDFVFDDYKFTLGYSDSAANVIMYYKQKEVLVKTSIDGYFDSVAATDINSDNIPDFYLYNNFEDGTDLYALISVSKNSFRDSLIASVSE